MTDTIKISAIKPDKAIPRGEILIEVEGLKLAFGDEAVCTANGLSCRVIGASSKRFVAVVPEVDDSSAVIQVATQNVESGSALISTGKLLASEMHMVSNPAIDPSDDALILTRSGSRGQQLPNTLYRLETDGFLDELPVEIMNPTGIAFAPGGELYVTSRSEGTVSRIERGESAIAFASGLGIATGIAFDGEGRMYVGDRSGTIYRVHEFGHGEHFAQIEPSVAAYHMAFGPDGRLYVTAPGFASFDSVYAVDADGNVDTYVRGLGRPQGLAFDRDGDLYVAACYGGRHGIVRIDAENKEIDHFVAGSNVVGICFTRNGELIAATNDSVYSLNLGIYGTLIS